MMKTLVYVEAQAGQVIGSALELIAGAHKLGDQVDLVLFGADAAAVQGMADRVFTDPTLVDAPYNPAQHAARLEAAIAQSQPDLILIGYTTAGLDIGPLVAMKRALPMLAYCLSAAVDGDTVRVDSQIYGGKLTSSAHSTLPAILMMNAGAFRDAPAPAGKATQIVNLSVAAPQAVRFVSATAPDPDAVDITKADRLLCVGRGIGDADVIEDAFETARLMGAELVGSRPVIDSGWLPKERQVGKSGRKVKPQVYLSVGVSGAPEHIEGMGDSGLIIAINTDAAAPIFDYAHLGATVDLADFLPAFREALANGTK